MTLTVDQAVEIATRAHLGQMDKNGVDPYILHPLAVLRLVQLQGGDIDVQVVAALHDVLEDTLVTVDDLKAAGATDAQIDALVALTRRVDEPYWAYVARALADPLARVVKVADHEHNVDEARLARLPPVEAARLRRKYAEVASQIAAAREQMCEHVWSTPARANNRHGRRSTSLYETHCERCGRSETRNGLARLKRDVMGSDTPIERHTP